VPLRIGILTFHYAINYGAMMQAHGLVDYLSRAGHDVQVIDFRTRVAKRTLLRDVARSRWRPTAMWRDLSKAIAFQRFAHGNFKNSPTFNQDDDLSLLNDRYDLIIAGSDQIWNIDMFGFEPAYFLDFVDPPRTRLAAYAPSAGPVQQWGDAGPKIAELLNRFHHLSVRDQHTGKLVKEASGRDVTHVLDPTFLGDFDTIVDDPGPPIDEPYILCYYVGRPKAVHVGFDLFKKRMGMKALVVGDPSPAADVTHIAVSPERWISYFRHASFVLTSSFHGTIFSILTRTPFAIPFRSDSMTRQVDLLSRIGLTDRIVDAATELVGLDDSFFEIDYDRVYKMLEQPVAESRRYLDGVLVDAQSALNS